MDLQMKNVILEVGSYTIVGDRASQQDALGCEWKDEMLLAVVCDGMGGMTGGELASSEAIQTIFQAFRQEAGIEERQIPSWLVQCFQEADARVSKLCDAAGQYLHAGTTVAAVLGRENCICWGAVGDSAIYYIHSGRIRRLNRLHNYHLAIDEMIKSGEITEKMAECERAQGEALISYLGVNGLPLLDISCESMAMEREDVLILCSDGLYKSLDEQQILAIVEESGENMDIAAKRLCDEAYRLARSSQDNTSVIVLRCVNDLGRTR